MQKIKKHQKKIEIDQVVFDSDFPSGNLLRAEKNQNGYNLWIGSDHSTNNYKTWFYFSITGIKMNTWINFTIKNMSNQAKLLKQGLLPVYKSQKQNNWKRIKQPISPSTIISSEEGLEFTFRFFFDSTQKIQFAFTYPWTLIDNDNLLNQLEKQSFLKKNQFFYSRTTLINSFQNRPIDLLTISTKRGISDKIVIGNDSLFPTGKLPYLFNNKKGVLISARVHPGQVPSSHIMNGLLKYLISFKPEVKLLLEQIVFYIIPIINPDGVQNGLYRSDSQGQNLNRFYTNPKKTEQPQIYGIKQFVSYMIKKGKIQSCIDLHAHAAKKGCFIYGNYVQQFNKQLQICLFAKLMSLNNKYFDYDACNFSEKNMYSKDKGDSLSKQGAARVAIFKDTNLHTCWTLECNYNMSRFMNKVTEKSNLTEKFNVGNLNKKIIMENGGDDVINGSDIYDIQCFQSIGKSIIQSLNDLYEITPQYSRVNSSEFKHMKVLKLNVGISILRMIPFRFENSIRKILLNLNSQDKIYQNLKQLLLIIQKKDSKYLTSVKQVLPEIKQIKKKFSTKSRGTSLGINKIKKNSIQKY